MRPAGPLLFGKTVEESTEYYTSELCVGEAQRHLSGISGHRSFPLELSQKILDDLMSGLVISVEAKGYSPLEAPAMLRIGRRDPADWPVVATALLLNAPVWTEDRDFFGIGIPTWTTDRIEIFLRS